MKKVLLGILMVSTVVLGFGGVLLVGDDTYAATGGGGNSSSSSNSNSGGASGTSTTYVTAKACTDKNLGNGKLNKNGTKCASGKYKGATIVTSVTTSQCKKKNLNSKKTKCAKGRYAGATITKANVKNITTSKCEANGGKVVTKKSATTCSGGTLNGFSVRADSGKNQANRKKVTDKTSRTLTYSNDSGTGVAGWDTGGTSTAGSSEAQAMLGEVGSNEDDLMTHVSRIINVVIGAVGVIAVVIIIVGGVSFATSQGEAAKVAKARNTILYGIVGLVVAILAFAIVKFVLSQAFYNAGDFDTKKACTEAGYTWDKEAGECK